jgi:putative hemolysin
MAPLVWQAMDDIQVPAVHESLASGGADTSLRIGLAESAADVLAAQRLRYRVFGEELSARLPEAQRGADCDRFDRFCDHLLVRAGARVVGTYRMLPPDRRADAGAWYSAGEFDVSRLDAVAEETVEIGRACVDPAYRTGRVIALLWAGLWRYVLGRGRFVIGCASIGTTDGGHVAASICRRLLRDHLAPSRWRVAPHRAFVLEGWRDVPDAPLPALIKGYLRLGAMVCGAPAWDGEFNSADLLMILPVVDTKQRYVDRLLRPA